MSGLSRITNNSFVIRLGGPSDDLVAVLRNGLRIPVNFGDYNGRMLFLFGTPDPKVVSTCRALLREGDALLDIGANHGAVGLLCHDIVGPGGAVHLFEPQPDLCRRIRACLATSNLTHVHLHEIGLMDRDGVLTLRLSPTHSGVASFVRGTDSDEVAQVPVRSAAKVLPDLVNGRPFGAKVDIEGAEMLLLPHLAHLDGLRFIIFECNSSSEREAIWDTARAARLTLFGIPKTLLRTRLTRLTSVGDLARYHDLVAVRLSSSSQVAGHIDPRSLANGLILQ